MRAFTGVKSKPKTVFCVLVSFGITPKPFGAVVLVVDIAAAVHAYRPKTNKSVDTLNFTGAGISVFKDSVFDAGIEKAAEPLVTIFIERAMDTVGKSRPL